MEIVLLIIGALIGGFISWAITHKYSEKSSKEIDGLQNLLQKMPEAITENITRYLQADEISNTEEIISNNNMSHASYVDINNDGIDELIIQFPAGPHGYALQAFSINNNDVKLIAEHGTDTPIEFEFEDINNDGKLELRSIETNQSSGHSYAMGIRDVVWYKFDNGEFVEIMRDEPSEQDIKEQVEFS